MERKIGEIFEYNGEWYQCLEKKYCNGCVFRDAKCDDVRKILGNCSVRNRSDKKSVIFKKLEKVGEPYSCNYYGDNRLIMMQEYNLFNLDDVTNEDKIPMYITDYKHKRIAIAIEIKQTKENMEEYRMYDAKEDIPEFDKVVDECLFGEDKLNLKPFNLQKAKEGKPVCTRNGRKARIICFDRDWDMHIVALVSDPLGESVHYYLSNGKVDFDKQNDEDLMMLPEKKEGWAVIRIYDIYETEEQAEDAIFNSHVGAMIRKITWEE